MWLLPNRVDWKSIHKEPTKFKKKWHYLDWKEERWYNIKRGHWTHKLGWAASSLIRPLSCKPGLYLKERKEPKWNVLTDGQEEEARDTPWVLRPAHTNAAPLPCSLMKLVLEPSCWAVRKPRSQLTVNPNPQGWGWAFRWFWPLAIKWPPASESPHLMPCRTGSSCSVYTVHKMQIHERIHAVFEGT